MATAVLICETTTFAIVLRREGGFSFAGGVDTLDTMWPVAIGCQEGMTR
ncbi:hypothetical protein AKJ09_05108 [Labilithrix luteola]|uniref:Uncharacterized protein n=1 Tax=Labilithrix luteola TaxID=1391654 RepID=A0A0K1PZ63_9BACT|nr:hypothetical protein AKJ09_05108 [Labilithrix luteola]